MKRIVACFLALLYMVPLTACTQPTHDGEEDFRTAYVTGEVLKIYDEYFLLKIEDYHGCFFYDKEIYVRDENTEKHYEIGDHVWVEYGGVFQDYDPPQVGANSITKIEGEATAPADVNWAYPEMVMIDGEMYLTTGMESTVNPRWAGYDGKITSTVSGSERPTENDQSNCGTGYGYQFGEKEGTVEIEINGKWWIFATEAVRHQIQFPEQHMVVDSPPDLIVNYEDQSVKARHCLTNWEYTTEDGMESALMGDGLHPLMAKHDSPFITLTSEAPMEVWLSWDIVPDLVEVNRWGEEAWEELETEPIESYRIMEGNEAGDCYLLRPEDGNYIYEIIATWQNAPNFGGTVRYSFHTE